MKVMAPRRQAKNLHVRMCESQVSGCQFAAGLLVPKGPLYILPVQALKNVRVVRYIVGVVVVDESIAECG